MADPEEFDLEQVRAVIRLAQESEIAELEVATPTLRVHVKKLPGGGLHVTHVQPHPQTGRQAPQTHSDAGGPVAGAPAGAPPELLNHLQPITAPMVGTFYRSPSPDAPPFIEEGDTVEAGQTVCIIEAMKLFNEIQSELRGRVVKVLAENGSPVEYGQSLFLVEPSAGTS